MKDIKIILADNSYLIREGLKQIISSKKGLACVAEAEKAEDLSKLLASVKADLLIIDYASQFFCLDDIDVIRTEYPDLHILAITVPQSKSVISKALANGVLSHLLKDCGKEEILEAIRMTHKGAQFFCGKVLNMMVQDEKSVSAQAQGISCDGVKLSSREVEIIQLVAKGLSNKEIADQLFLSVHTITTHRKNIMSKLGVNNTAGLVMFAIRENLVEPNHFLFN